MTNFSIKNTSSIKTLVKEFKKISVIILIENNYKFSILKKTLDSIINFNYLNKIDISILTNKKIKQIKKDINNFLKINKINIHQISNNFYEYIKENIEIYNDYIFFINAGDTISIDCFRKMHLEIYKEQLDLLLIRYANSKKSQIYIYEDWGFLECLDMRNESFFDSYIKSENRIKELGSFYGKLISKNILINSFKEISFGGKIQIKYLNFLLIFMIFKNSKKIKFLKNELYFLLSRSKQIKNKNEIWDINCVYGLIEKNLSSINLEILKKWKINFFIINLEKKFLIKFSKELNKILNNEDYQYIIDFFSQKKEFHKLIPIVNNIKELWDIKKKIYNSNVISFDVFDTLILRNFWEPTDLFEILNYKISNLIPIKDFFDFKTIRILAEKKCREKYKREITIDEIYEQIIYMIPLKKNVLNKIKQIEIDLEIKYSEKRDIAYELFSYAAHLNKKIYVVSDMYLPTKVILQILNKNGYFFSDIDKIFVSSEIKKSKNDTRIWEYINESEKIELNDIFHIGDNFNDDYVKPKNKKIKTFWLPKSTEIFLGKTKYYSSLFFKFLSSDSSIFHTSSWQKCFGLKTYFSLVANKFFSNPFKIITYNVDFENNPYLFGYFALGFFMISLTKWLIEIQKEKKYSTFNFNLRDGYLPKIFFDKMSTFEKIKVKTNFTYFSRNSLLPILFISENNNNKISLVNYFHDLSNSKKAIYLIDKLKDIISEENYNKLYKKFKNFNISNIDNLLIFINYIYENNINADIKKFPWKKFKNIYLNNLFPSKSSTALFDIGYSGRISSILKETFNIKFDEYYVNSAFDKCFQRQNKNNLNIKTFFDYSVNLNGLFREIVFSSQENSCTSFKYENGKFVEKFDKYSNKNIFSIFLINTIQKGAIDIFDELIKIYGDDSRFLNFRKMEMSIPLEYFYNYSTFGDRFFLKKIYIENDFDWHNLDKNVLIHNLQSDWDYHSSNNSMLYKSFTWSETYLKLNKFKKLWLYLIIDKNKVFKLFLNFIKKIIKRR